MDRNGIQDEKLETVEKEEKEKRGRQTKREVTKLLFRIFLISKNKFSVEIKFN